MLVAPPEFFQQAQAICRRHGILLVSDEVKVGLGRPGRLHCYEHLGIEPDIVVLGKGLGGGLPVSAAVGPVAIMNHASAFSFQTLHGNPACASAALAVLDTINRENLVSHAARVGSHLLGLLKGLQDRHPLVGDVRGHGLALGVELVTNRDSRAPAAQQTALTVFRAHQLGLVIYYVGTNANVLEFAPPLTITKGEVEEGVALLDQALSDVEQGRIDPTAAAGFSGWD